MTTPQSDIKLESCTGTQHRGMEHCEHGIGSCLRDQLFRSGHESTLQIYDKEWRLMERTNIFFQNILFGPSLYDKGRIFIFMVN